MDVKIKKTPSAPLVMSAVALMLLALAWAFALWLNSANNDTDIVSSTFQLVSALTGPTLIFLGSLFAILDKLGAAATVNESSLTIKVNNKICKLDESALFIGNTVFFEQTELPGKYEEIDLHYVRSKDLLYLSKFLRASNN